MSEALDSVYPDLLKTGVGRLTLLDARRELLGLFSALEHLRRDLHAQKDVAGILDVSRGYVGGLELLSSFGFWTVDPKDLSFELALAVPEGEKEALKGIVRREIKAGHFARALKQGGPAFFHAGTPEKPVRGLFHSLAVSSQVVGMFCGLLRGGLAPVHEITFSLLSLVLGTSADALATLRKTTELTTQIETLTGLLPVCAWCKKVCDDNGSWETIEKFISSRSSASITHSICPDCQKKYEAEIPWKR